jgi:hypothetical protein
MLSRMTKHPTKELKPPFFNLDQLGERWFCHPKTAQRRLQKLGVKPMKLTERSVLFRAEDIERIEKQCI